MRTIYKYKLAVVDEQEIQIPDFAEILSVQNQNGELCLWALVNSDNKPEPWTIQIVGTGNPASGINAEDFIGTVQQHDGGLVWHVFAHLS